MKTMLLGICQKLGLVADESMTIAEIQTLIDGYQPPVRTDSSNQDVLPPIVTPKADDVFKQCGRMETFSGVKLMFIGSSQSGLRLIVRKPNDERGFGVYIFERAFNASKAKVGDSLTILAEERQSSDGKLYWNCQALNVERG